LPIFSNAQLLFCLPQKTNATTYSGGLYGRNLIFTAGIARGFHVKIFKLFNEDVTLFMDFSDKSNFANKNEFRFLYGGQSNLIKIKKYFKVPFRKTATVSRINTEEVNATYLGAELELMPGIYKQKYFMALDLYYGDSFKGFVTKSEQKFSDLLNELGTGWIKPHRSTFKIGLIYGYYLKPNLVLYGYYDFLIVKPKVDAYALAFSHGAIGLTYVFGRSSQVNPPHIEPTK
jgi:hypothetical protein